MATPAAKPKIDPDEQRLMENFTYLACCGIREIISLRNIISELGAEGVAKAFAKVVAHKALMSAFVIFSEVREGGNTYGQAFNSFIAAKGLGPVLKTETVQNPNSGNFITVYVWQMNRDALKAWHKEFAPDDPVYTTILPPQPVREPPQCGCQVCVRAREAEREAASPIGIYTLPGNAIPF